MSLELARVRRAMLRLNMFTVSELAQETAQNKSFLVILITREYEQGYLEVIVGKDETRYSVTETGRTEFILQNEKAQAEWVEDLRAMMEELGLSLDLDKQPDDPGMTIEEGRAALARAAERPFD